MREPQRVSTYCLLVGRAIASLAQRLHHMYFLSLLTPFISVFQECGLHALHCWTALYKHTHI